MKQPRERIRTLAVALGAAISIMSATTALVSADTKAPADPGVRCAAKTGPGQYEFYLPGEKATDTSGQKWVCGPDGMWFKDYSALTIFVRPPVIKTATLTLAAAILH